MAEDTLAHCMKIANSKIVICTPDLATYVRDLFVQSKEAQPCLSLNLSSFGPLQLSEEDARATNMTQIRYEDFQLASTFTTVPQRVKRNLKDIGALVYTSGTSGKPKAVSIKNFCWLLFQPLHPLMRKTQNGTSLFEPILAYP